MVAIDKTGKTERPVVIHVATAAGQALSGECVSEPVVFGCTISLLYPLVGDDYAVVDKDVVLLANESTVAVEIPLVNDEIAERNEPFSLSISGLKEYALVYDIFPSQALVDILNDDCKYVILKWLCEGGALSFKPFL